MIPHAPENRKARVAAGALEAILVFVPENLPCKQQHRLWEARAFAQASRTAQASADAAVVHLRRLGFSLEEIAIEVGATRLAIFCHLLQVLTHNEKLELSSPV